MNALENLGIDAWGLVLYLVNFGILAFVLTKLLYKPILKTLDERRKNIQENLSEAERLKTDFQKEMDQRSAEHANLVKQIQLELAETRSAAETRAKAVIAAAEAKRETLLTEANAQIEDMKQRLVADVEQELLKKIEAIALRAMRDGAPKESVKKSVTDAWKELQGSNTL